VTPTDELSGPPGSHAIVCEVSAHASLAATPEEIPALRQKPGPGVGESLPANFLKHADDQTVVGLAAVLRAVASSELSTQSLTHWGIVAAPCFLGRATLVSALQRFADEGAWGLSPHFIPHRSQHAISGTISQALKIHGPNFGTGGGPGGVIEALRAGAVLLHGDRLPGVLVVMTDWEPEFLPDPDGRPVGNTKVHAVALALVSLGQKLQALRLLVGVQPEAARQTASGKSAALTVPHLSELLPVLADTNGPGVKLIADPSNGAQIELGRANGTVRIHPSQLAAVSKLGHTSRVKSAFNSSYHGD
jgi:hypothetical protein